MNMTASANPLPITYDWTKEVVDPVTGVGSGSEVSLASIVRSSKGRLEAKDGVLNVSDVYREDAGYYTVTATNAEGSTQTNIRIDVLYAPR